MSPAKWWPFCLDRNVFNHRWYYLVLCSHMDRDVQSMTSYYLGNHKFCIGWFFFSLFICGFKVNLTDREILSVPISFAFQQWLSLVSGSMLPWQVIKGHRRSSLEPNDQLRSLTGHLPWIRQRMTSRSTGHLGLLKPSSTETVAIATGQVARAVTSRNYLVILTATDMGCQGQAICVVCRSCNLTDPFH